MTNLLLCSLVDNNHHWVFKAIAWIVRRLIVQTAPLTWFLVCAVCLVQSWLQSLTWAAQTVECSLATLGSVTSNDAEIGCPIVMQVVTLLQSGCRSTSFAASCQPMQASLRF